MTSLNQLVSLSECSEVVRREQAKPRDAETSDIRIVSFRLEKVPGQPGFLGEYAHLIVTVEVVDGGTKDLKYFVKCLPYTDPKQREIVQEIGIFKKEAVTYQELFAKFNQDSAKVTKWCPSCWLARDDLLVMEDLYASGYRPMPSRRGFEEAHMLVIFDSLAQMHACSLDLEFNQMGGERLDAKFGSMLFENTFTEESTWFTVGLKGILKVALEGSKYGRTAAWKEKMSSEMYSKMERIYDLIKPTDHFQSVVIHRDLWFNNMMFKFKNDPLTGLIHYDNPTSCVLIDFQIARYLPPAIDFLSAIYLLTRRSHRDQHYDSYVEYYYRKLREKLHRLNLNLDDVLPWQQFLESLQHYRLVGLLWSGILLGFVNLPEGFLGDLHVTDVEAYHRFCLVSRDDIIMDFFRKDDHYRERLLDSVDETIEYLFGFE
ncbi:uncharacterized protein LOC128743767 [Sabethes cyaneus]|uniref:uncharacterized protein LOC128743767 n=1 Tax=Sabethes cyaneus TaxID=53552 RepID=UPI00237E1EBC|nr:uncharacterized protein LOC128743767 [Sabethes cyaneus]